MFSFERFDICLSIMLISAINNIVNTAANMQNVTITEDEGMSEIAAFVGIKPSITHG